MPLILAIEPDRHQAAQIASIAQGRVGAELVLADTAERALRALGNRVPDLILTPPLLSPRDDAAITDRLRELGTAATFVQTLTIPALATAQTEAASSRARGLLSALRRQKAPAPAPNGCAPDVFADQIAVYLERALEARAAHGDTTPSSPIEPEVVATQEPAPVMLDSFVPPLADVASGFTHFDVASGFSRKEAAELEQEWPARVGATVAADVAAPAVDVWEPSQPAIASAPIEEPRSLNVTSTLSDHGTPTHRGTEDESTGTAVPIPEHAIEPEWTIRLDPAPAEEISPIELVGEETVVVEAAVDPRVAPCEARSPEPGEARETAPAFTAPWVETDLTELVDAIAEPGVDPEPAILETPLPVPVARVPEAPPAAPPRPKAVKPANRKRRARPAPKDDWRFFDPEETRFAALLAKLDEITSTDGASHSPRPRA